MRRDLNTCSRQSAMHHGVRVRVSFRRSLEHHSRNDGSSSTSWSHDVHAFSHIRARYFSEGSVQHPPPYSFRKRVLVRPVMKRIFFPWLGFTRAFWRSFSITNYLPQPPIVFASSSIDKHGSQLSTAGIRQQTAAAPTSQ